HVIANRDDAMNNLASALEYRLIANKISRQPGGKQPSMLEFNRPEESWKYLYDLAVSEETRNTLRDSSERNPALRVLNQGLQNNPIPPWEAFSRYLAPGGAMMVNDESGFHYMQFSLRRK